VLLLHSCNIVASELRICGNPLLSRGAGRSQDFGADVAAAMETAKPQPLEPGQSGLIGAPSASMSVSMGIAHATSNKQVHEQSMRYVPYRLIEKKYRMGAPKRRDASYANPRKWRQVGGCKRGRCLPEL
jgi:hypothetical protein